MVTVVCFGSFPEVEGAGFVTRIDIATPNKWCHYYGSEICGDSAILFKALDNDYKSSRGFAYIPGTVVEAPDWDEGKAECGGGLHFSPSPKHALEFFPNAIRFVACKVPLSEIVTCPEGQYPQKCKAPRAIKIWEVDRDGNRL
jgi:hypothetical protein